MVSCCQSTMRWSQAISAVVVAAPSLDCSLYPQCAAMPYSARRCISLVRIWTSMGLPSSPITVVCSDW